MSTLAIILIVLLLLGGIGTGPYWGYSRGWGWAPSSIIWVILIVVLLFLLVGPA